MSHETDRLHDAATFAVNAIGIRDTDLRESLSYYLATASKERNTEGYDPGHLELAKIIALADIAKELAHIRNAVCLMAIKTEN